MLVSSKAYFFDDIMNILRSDISVIYLIVSISFAKSIVIILILFIKRMPRWFFSFFSFFIQLVLLTSYFIGYIDLSLFLNIIGRMFLAKFSFVKAISLTLNFLYLTFNTIFAVLRLASINRISIKIFFHIPVITRAFLLIMPYIIFFSVI